MRAMITRTFCYLCCKHLPSVNDFVAHLTSEEHLSERDKVEREGLKTWIETDTKDKLAMCTCDSTFEKNKELICGNCLLIRLRGAMQAFLEITIRWGNDGVVKKELVLKRCKLTKLISTKMLQGKGMAKTCEPFVFNPRFEMVPLRPELRYGRDRFYPWFIVRTYNAL